MSNALFEGQSLQLLPLAEGQPGGSHPQLSGVVELRFDRQGEAINKLCGRTMAEWGQAVTQLKSLAEAGTLRGVLVTSAKDVFIVGADITGMGPMFAKSAAQIAADTGPNHAMANAFEDLPVPTVAALNGYALGGGLEIALTADARVMSTAAQVGVPEVKLGLLPGLAGTVRLTRLCGPEAAADWVAGGVPRGAEAARAAGVVDAVSAPDALRATALQWLDDALAGHVDWRAAQARKRGPVALPADALRNVFHRALERIRAGSAPHQPAADIAVSAMAAGAPLPRDGAIALEAQAFGEVFQTQAAHALVQAFLNEQAVKKAARKAATGATPPQALAVLGAGIMGAGIAATAVARGTPQVRLKDTDVGALQRARQGLDKLLQRQVAAGRLKAPQAAERAQALHTQTDDTGLAEVPLLIEAVTERLVLKHAVLGPLAAAMPADAVIASNTSSLRIADIAAPLAHPERVVGLHFFNPVPQMPLVEVVRGPASTPAAVARAVAQVQAMGKTAIVVADVPGFLVNRCFTPYVLGWLQLLADGADFEGVDRVMQGFGWPMGPALLQDVIGMDTGVAVFATIAAGYPERMAPVAGDAVQAMVQAGRLGQKSGAGFYRHGTGPDGKPQRQSCADARALVAALQAEGPKTFSEREVIDRLMLPMVLEAARALDEGVVASPAELDTAMVLGLGFPAYAGGPLKYADWCGLAAIVQRAEALAAQLKAHAPVAAAALQVPAGLRERAARGDTFHHWPA